MIHYNLLKLKQGADTAAILSRCQTVYAELQRSELSKIKGLTGVDERSMGDVVERLLILLHLHLTLVAGIIERIVGTACHERVVEVVVFESQAKLSLSVKQLGS